MIIIKNKTHKVNKPFKTIEQQVNLLVDRGLIIENENLFKWYLSRYNYQNIISGYITPFVKGQRRESNKFIENTKSSDLINFFNFDRWLSNKLLTNIQNIERSLGSAISYKFCELMTQYGFHNGEIFYFLEYADSFSLEQIQIQRKDNLKFIFNKIYSENSRNDIFSCYEDINIVPIWKLVIYATFGDILHIYQNLPDNLKIEIIKFCFPKIVSDTNNILDSINFILKTLKNIRNRCCHNNVIYDYKIKDKSIWMIKLFIKKNLNYKTNNVKLFDIIRICDKLISSKENGLEDHIKNQLKSNSKIFKIEQQESKDYILRIMNFNINKKGD